MGVDEVEDARMAAEEGFVYACATGQQGVRHRLRHLRRGRDMDFSLGEDLGAADADESLELVEALLAAICDESSISEDGRTLSLTKRTAVPMTSSAPKPEGARAEERVPQAPQRDASEARAVRRAPKARMPGTRSAPTSSSACTRRRATRRPVTSSS